MRIVAPIPKKSRIRETPTLSTDADSRTDTNLKRLRDLNFKKREKKKKKKKMGDGCRASIAHAWSRRVDAWTRQPALFYLFFKDKLCNLSKIVLFLLSASVERFFVSRMRDFFGIGATIRISREMLCLPYAGFFLCSFKTLFQQFEKIDC